MEKFFPSLRRLAVIAAVFLTSFAGSCWDIGGETPCSPTDPSCGGSPAPSSRALSVPFIQQQTQLWCWAATSEMIFRYYGVPASQCQLVSTYLNRQCCTGDPSCVVASGNMQTIQQGLLVVGGVRSTYLLRPLTFDEVASEISAGRPIMLAYRGSFAGHVVLLTGYDRTTGLVRILDPNYGVIDVPFGATFSYGGQLIWTETLVGITR